MTIQASVVGRLTSDPDLKFTQSGKAVANLTIAVNHRKKDQQGNYQDSGATFLRVSLWEHQAEQAAEHLRKGQLVQARGRIETRQYEKDGETRTSLEMQVDDIGQLIQKYPPRDHSQSGYGNPGQQNPSADPWGSQPQSQQGGWETSDEPPF